MNECSWEMFIDECPHCNKYISLHHRSTISERHLMELIFTDINQHKTNECLNIDTGLKRVNIEVEIESRSSKSVAILYKYVDMNILF
jgi:hypothetical protein